ncbi:16S rRNA (cytosine(1402)-N(4))-methyltransferase RsmH [Flavobacteriales bacterium]|jgi:16S rRNA (cytosine1402-N4)-methyltransferase|nr:16S rRNA (cytosine(1402)-N(4))-methyltransferase RsmH [Flavobacteriales bacterium]
MTKYHDPVLLDECLEGLNLRTEGIYVDVTFGGGGHSRAIVSKLDEGHLYAFDQDDDALENEMDDDRFTLINANFRDLKNSLRMYGVKEIDGLLADLGVSSHQFDVPDRGFSTRFDADLDMRMDQNSDLNAAKILNAYEQDELRNILKNYGELKRPGTIARVIYEAKEDRPIETVQQLKALLKPFAPKMQENKFFAQVFQALRIEVNDELNALKEMLTQAQEILKPGGRLVVISYHSLEDRLVKNLIQKGNFEGELEQDFYGNKLLSFKKISRKPILPTEQEIQRNNRARSAKLRVAEKL